MIELIEITKELTPQPHAFLSLPIDSRIKSRLKVILDDGRDAGLFLPRGIFFVVENSLRVSVGS